MPASHTRTHLRPPVLLHIHATTPAAALALSHSELRRRTRFLSRRFLPPPLHPPLALPNCLPPLLSPLLHLLFSSIYTADVAPPLLTSHYWPPIYAAALPPSPLLPCSIPDSPCHILLLTRLDLPASPLFVSLLYLLPHAAAVNSLGHGPRSCTPPSSSPFLISLPWSSICTNQSIHFHLLCRFKSQSTTLAFPFIFNFVDMLLAWARF